MKATFVADVSAEFNGHAELFKLDTAMRVGDTKRGRKYNHIVVSAVNSRWTTETYIFPSNQNGEILDYTELHGSYKGDTNIDRALAYGGYEVVRPLPEPAPEEAEFVVLN